MIYIYAVRVGVELTEFISYSTEFISSSCQLLSGGGVCVVIERSLVETTEN